jgi:serine/threonine-protein kinase
MNVGLGDTVGAYRIVGELGMGGSGKVFRARHTITGRIEALKVLAHSGEPGSERAEQFLQEIRLQANIEHPNVAVVHNAFWFDQTLVMVMEFVDGTSLRELLQGGSLAISSVVDYARQALSALEYTHSRGVTHRDISPSNILITPSGTVKITDFGLAAVLGPGPLHAKKDGNLVGSAYYMSPEQVRSAADLDVRTDIYSLGAVLYEAFTGTRLFPGDSAYAVMEAHVEQKPDPPSKRKARLSPEIDRFILKAIEKDRDARYSSMAEFAKALDRLGIADSAEGAIEEDSLADGSATPDTEAAGNAQREPPPAASPAAQHRLLYGVAGFAAVLLIALIVWAWSGTADSDPHSELAALADSQSQTPTPAVSTPASPEPSLRPDLAPEAPRVEDTSEKPQEITSPERRPTRARPSTNRSEGRRAPPKQPDLSKPTTEAPLSAQPAKPSPVASSLADDRRTVTPLESAARPSRDGPARDPFIPAPTLDAGAPVRAVALSRDGRAVAAALHDDTIVVWKISGRRKAILRGHTDRVTALAFSPNGRRLASGSADGTAKVWDIRRQRETKTLGHKGGVNSVTFGPLGRRLATGSDDKAVSLWDLTGRGAFREYRGHKGPARAVAFSPNGNQIVSASREVRLWTTEATTRPTRLEGLPRDADAVAFSRNGRNIAAAGAHEVGVWDIQKGRRRQVVRVPGSHYALSFTNQGRWIAVAASSSPSGEVSVWDLADPYPLASLRGEGMLRSVALTEAAEVIAAAGDDGRILVWRKNMADRAAGPRAGELANVTKP